MSRYEFFGRDTISFLVVLPIALPGIVTGHGAQRDVHAGCSASSSRCSRDRRPRDVLHRVVYNNVVARLRRTSASLEEATADLGATPWQTFGHVTFPQLRSAVLAGALLAFALSLRRGDRHDVHRRATQTLPIWILNNLSRPEPAADRQRRRASS